MHVLILAALVLLPWISAYPGAAQDATPESAAAISQADWPMYRGDAARTGARDGRGPANDPIELWRYQAEGSINSAPAVVGGVVFVGCECNQLLALDAATGAVRWQFATTDSVTSSPAVADGIVYVGSSDDTLYAVDAEDGSERWQFPGTRADGSPAVVDGVVYTGGADGQLYALDAASGEERWAAPLGESASRSPAVADGMVFIGSSDGVLHAIDSARGEERWQFTADVDGVLATTAVGNGMVYQAVISSSDPQFYALDAVTGMERWRFSNDEPGGLYPPVVRDDLVITISEQGVIYALEPTNGEEQWQVETGDTVHAPPALVGDVLYVASLDRSLAARSADTGDELWDFALNSDVEYGPTIVDGIAYLGSKAGSIYAIGSAEASGAGASASAAVEQERADPALVESITGGDAPLDGPSGVVFDRDGNLYVVDSQNDQIKIFAPSGELAATWGETGDEPGQFRFHNNQGSRHGDVAIGPDGSIYVSDPFNGRAQNFTPEREHILTIGSPGSGDGQFGLVQGGIAADAEGLGVSTWRTTRMRALWSSMRTTHFWPTGMGRRRLTDHSKARTTSPLPQTARSMPRMSRMAAWCMLRRMARCSTRSARSDPASDN